MYAAVLQPPRMRHSFKILMLLFVGCAGERTSESSPVDATNEVREKTLHAAPTRSLAEVDAAALKAAPKLEAQVPERIARVLPDIAVPVLLPDNTTLLETVKFTHRRDWYGAAMQQGDVRLYVHGTRKQVTPPAALDIPKGEEVQVSIAEGTPVATFMRFGASYMVEVSCAAPFKDTACTGESFVRSLVASLRVAGSVGGAP